MEKPCFTRNRAAIPSPRSPTLLFSVFSAMYKKYTRTRRDNVIRETHRKYAGLLKHLRNKANTHSCSSVSRITQENDGHTLKKRHGRIPGVKHLTICQKLLKRTSSERKNRNSTDQTPRINSFTSNKEVQTNTLKNLEMVLISVKLQKIRKN